MLHYQTFQFIFRYTITFRPTIEFPTSKYFLDSFLAKQVFSNAQLFDRQQFNNLLITIVLQCFDFGFRENKNVEEMERKIMQKMSLTRLWWVFRLRYILRRWDSLAGFFGLKEKLPIAKDISIPSSSLAGGIAQEQKNRMTSSSRFFEWLLLLNLPRPSSFEFTYFLISFSARSSFSSFSPRSRQTLPKSFTHSQIKVVASSCREKTKFP